MHTKLSIDECLNALSVVAEGRIFTFPIYRVTRLKHFEDIAKKAVLTTSWEAEEYLRQKHGAYCDFNRVVGLVHIDRNKNGPIFYLDVVCRQYRTDRTSIPFFKRVTPDVNIGWHPLHIENLHDPEEVFKKIEGVLACIVTGKPFKKCWIDYQALKNTYRYIDWAKLIEGDSLEYAYLKTENDKQPTKELF